MSWIALVGPEFEENLSLRYLASSLAAAGYRAELLPFNRESDLVRIVDHIVRAPEAPLLVGGRRHCRPVSGTEHPGTPSSSEGHLAIGPAEAQSARRRSSIG